jgi:hypothetical protein
MGPTLKDAQSSSIGCDETKRSTISTATAVSGSQESSATAHYWAREVVAIGYGVRLMPTVYA